MGVIALATVDCDECGKRVEDMEMIEYPMYDGTLYGINQEEGYELEGWYVSDDGMEAKCPECKDEEDE